MPALQRIRRNAPPQVLRVSDTAGRKRGTHFAGTAPGCRGFARRLRFAETAAILPCLTQISFGRARAARMPNPVANQPASGIFEETLFTCSSSLGFGALRRAGWALAAKDADLGPVPADLLPRWTSRDGDDHAAAMARLLPSDPRSRSRGTRRRRSCTRAERQSGKGWATTK